MTEHMPEWIGWAVALLVGGLIGLLFWPAFNAARYWLEALRDRLRIVSLHASQARKDAERSKRLGRL